MIEKQKILESWIMVEHLSEGDISLKDKAILTLESLRGQDFYSLFLHEIEKRNGTGDRREELLSILMSFHFRK